MVELWKWAYLSDRHPLFAKCQTLSAIGRYHKTG